MVTTDRISVAAQIDQLYFPVGVYVHPPYLIPGDLGTRVSPIQLFLQGSPFCVISLCTRYTF